MPASTSEPASLRGVGEVDLGAVRGGGLEEVVAWRGGTAASGAISVIAGPSGVHLRCITRRGLAALQGGSLPSSGSHSWAGRVVKKIRCPSGETAPWLKIASSPPRKVPQRPPWTAAVFVAGEQFEGWLPGAELTT